MYTWVQDVPIDRATYGAIIGSLGDKIPQGLLLHLALEQEGGTLRYVDIWDDKESCEKFTDERLHPAVGPALRASGIQVEVEPPRVEAGLVHMWGTALKKSVTA
ncbi:MAG: hypothetical protein ABIQ61_12900 [Ornithinibacter sp.]